MHIIYHAIDEIDSCLGDGDGDGDGDLDWTGLRATRKTICGRESQFEVVAPTQLLDGTVEQGQHAIPGHARPWTFLWRGPTRGPERGEQVSRSTAACVPGHLVRI